jgi:hypothetical protein
MQCGQNVQLLNVKLVGASRNQKVKDTEVDLEIDNTARDLSSAKMQL